MSRLARYLLGLVYALSGIAGLFNLIPPPAGLPDAMIAFMNGLMATTYFFPLLKITETICGLMLVLGIAPALALIVLAPVTLNILLLHIFVTPGVGNLVLPAAIAVLHLFCGLHYWARFKPIFARA